MAYEPKDGEGALFGNEKGQNERAPDFKGYVQWKGERIELAGWKRTPKNGGSIFLSLKAQESRGR